jgi:DHA1 family bicyclomycin/chloramphenicol resistance-like MFS transporter
MSMALGALGIDLMLPAFDAMRADLGLAADSNAIAATITTYFIGLALGTLIYGPLADRFGRRPALFTGFAIYAVGALASALAPSLEVLLFTRFVWGIGAASSRVVAFAIIRDAYEGEEMSRAMSLVMAVFILVPIVAPTIGAGIVALTSWRWVFGACVLAVAGMAAWATRMPETLHEEYRMDSSFSRLAEAARQVVSNRITVSYALAMTALYAILISYLGSAEIMFSRTFDQARNFPYIFGGLASVMGVAMVVNARIVRGIGTRRIAHGVLAFYMVGAVGLAVLAAVTGGRPPLAVFLVGLAVMFGSHALLVPNLNSIAMQPMAEVAGTASSITGALQTGLGALLAAVVDRAFDGTVTPLCLAFAGYGAVALLLILWAERGRLGRSGSDVERHGA